MCSEARPKFQRSLPVGQSAICKEGGTFPSSLEVAARIARMTQVKAVEMVFPHSDL